MITLLSPGLSPTKMRNHFRELRPDAIQQALNVTLWRCSGDLHQCVFLDYFYVSINAGIQFKSLFFGGRSNNIWLNRSNRGSWKWSMDAHAGAFCAVYDNARILTYSSWMEFESKTDKGLFLKWKPLLVTALVKEGTRLTHCSEPLSTQKDSGATISSTHRFLEFIIPLKLLALTILMWCM